MLEISAKTWIFHKRMINEKAGVLGVRPEIAYTAQVSIIMAMHSPLESKVAVFDADREVFRLV
jgi:hypothetical protein